MKNLVVILLFAFSSISLAESVTEKTMFEQQAEAYIKQIAETQNRELTEDILAKQLSILINFGEGYIPTYKEQLLALNCEQPLGYFQAGFNEITGFINKFKEYSKMLPADTETNTDMQAEKQAIKAYIRALNIKRFLVTKVAAECYPETNSSGTDSN